MKLIVLCCVIVAGVFAVPEAPYPARGWRPAGQQFSLPSRATEYGAPSQEYGPVEETTTDYPSTTEQSTEETNSTNSQNPERFLAHYNQANDQYFIITPEGQIQHISIPNLNFNNQNNEQETRDVENEKQKSGQLKQAPLGRLVKVSTVRGSKSSQLQIRPATSSRYTQQNVNQQSTVPAQEYFFLTADGRLQRINGAQDRQQTNPNTEELTARYRQVTVSARQQQAPAENQPSGNADLLVLLPDGRFHRVGVSSNSQTQSQTGTNIAVEVGGKYRVLQTENNDGNADLLILLPDGRFERLVVANNVVQRREIVPASAVKEENGQYYLILPGGKLQRVQYMNVLTGDRLTANVQYQDVDPLMGPVYTYGSPLVRVL